MIIQAKKESEMSKFMKWLTKCGFFKANRLIFIIKVHTKNICNQLINLVETMYPKNNIPKINLMSIFLNNISLLFLGQLKFVSSPLITGNSPMELQIIVYSLWGTLENYQQLQVKGSLLQGQNKKVMDLMPSGQTNQLKVFIVEQSMFHLLGMRNKILVIPSPGLSKQNKCELHCM